MCTVAAASGRPASESGTLRHGDGTHRRSDRCRRSFVLPILPEVPVIMITAYGDADTKRKALENGATGLLTKPIDFSLLREEIDNRLAAAN